MESFWNVKNPVCTQNFCIYGSTLNIYFHRKNNKRQFKTICPECDRYLYTVPVPMFFLIIYKISILNSLQKQGSGTKINVFNTKKIDIYFSMKMHSHRHTGKNISYGLMVFETHEHEGTFLRQSYNLYKQVQTLFSINGCRVDTYDLLSYFSDF